MTSRVEGGHSLSKRYIGVKLYSFLTLAVANAYFQVANGDLYTVYGNIVRLVNDQHYKYSTTVATQLVSVSHDCNTPIYAPLIGKVTSYALNKMAKELARSRQPGFPRVCTSTFTKAMGLPCAHELRRCHEAHTPLQPSQIHRHWYYLPGATPADTPFEQSALLLNPTSSEVPAAGLLEADVLAEEETLDASHESSPLVKPHNRPLPPDEVPLLDPVPTVGRGRPARSTRRDPSEFETVGARVRRRRVRETAAAE
jgi:hypothetical protein